MMDDTNLGAGIMAASRGLEAALLNTTENFITASPRHEFYDGTNDGARARSSMYQ